MVFICRLQPFHVLNWQFAIFWQGGLFTPFSLAVSILIHPPWVLFCLIHRQALSYFFIYLFIFNNIWQIMSLSINCLNFYLFICSPDAPLPWSLCTLLEMLSNYYTLLQMYLKGFKSVNYLKKIIFERSYLNKEDHSFAKTKVMLSRYIDYCSFIQRIIRN